MNLEIRKDLSRKAGRLAYMNGQPASAVEETNPLLIIKAEWREGYTQELIYSTVAQNAVEQEAVAQGHAEGKTAFQAGASLTEAPYYPVDTGDRIDALKARGWLDGMNAARLEDFRGRILKEHEALIRAIESESGSAKPHD